MACTDRGLSLPTYTGPPTACIKLYTIVDTTKEKKNHGLFILLLFHIYYAELLPTGLFSFVLWFLAPVA